MSSYLVNDSLVPSALSPPQSFSLEGIEIEKSEPIVRLLAHVRKGGMDILFPQISHDKMLACIYVAITSTYTAAHRELLDLVMAVKDSGCISQVEHVSKTKIRGMLALLKHDNLLITQSMEGQPARLCFAPDIQSFYDLRMRHDRFLERYMMEHHLFVPAFLRGELLWQIDEETYYHRMEGLNNLMKHVAEFYAGYLGVPLMASNLSAQIPVRQMLPTNRNPLKNSEDLLGRDNYPVAGGAGGVSSLQYPYGQTVGSTASSCTTLSDSTSPFGAIGSGFVERDCLSDLSCLSSNGTPNSSFIDSFSSFADKNNHNSVQNNPSPSQVDWYNAGRRTSSSVQAAAMATVQQQALTSHYLNRVAQQQPKYPVQQQPKSVPEYSNHNNNRYSALTSPPSGLPYLSRGSPYPSYFNGNGFPPQMVDNRPQQRVPRGYGAEPPKIPTQKVNFPEYSYANKSYLRSLHDNSFHGMQHAPPADPFFSHVETSRYEYSDSNVYSAPDNSPFLLTNTSSKSTRSNNSFHATYLHDAQSEDTFAAHFQPAEVLSRSPGHAFEMSDMMHHMSSMTSMPLPPREPDVERVHYTHVSSLTSSSKSAASLWDDILEYSQPVARSPPM